jgi:CHAT domain-containing protein/pimeloyl-ACP methyl ester carboxylesterase
MPDPPFSDPDQQPELDAHLREFINVEVVRTEKVDAGSRSARAVEFRLDDARDDDVIELELQAGITGWVSVKQLREDLGPSRSAGPGITIPGTIPRRRQLTRGIGDWVLKGLKLLRVDPVDPIADVAIDVLISQFETKLTPNPGLYLLDQNLVPTTPASTSILESSEPLLVFLHGTASNTAGGFGRLASDEWNQLSAEYGGRVFGLEHHTLSVSPIRNALELANQLPKGARLHLVSHSRGGLVGELLALDTVPDSALEPFVNANRAAEVGLLKELIALLKEKAFRVERFVRVACPARGTLLASDRLDLYLSLVLSIIGRIPVLKESLIYAFLKATAIEVARRRTKPDELPGLEAMIPSSVLINFLNGSGTASKADLAVIAGDIEGEGILGSLKVFASDLFFRTDHDLVVNTSSMYGGPQREKLINFFFDHGGDVSHFNYFANSRTRAPLIGWLRGESSSGFSELTPGSSSPRSARRLATSKPESVVVILPDLMTSSLAVNGTPLWLNASAIQNGNLQKLRLTADDNATTNGAFESTYQPLVEALEGKSAVRVFAYDWRRSVFDAAQALASVVESEMEKHQLPIRFVGHGMGGLVVRAMMSARPDLWQSIRERRGRLLMLGTANRGTWAVARILLGVDRLLRRLTLMDFAAKPAQIAGVFASFPGLLEQLPFESDCLNVDWWRRMAGHGFEDSAIPESQALGSAKRSQELIAGAIDTEGMLYLAGSAAVTPCSLRGDDVSGFRFTEEGDGFTTNAQGRAGFRGWRVSASHGELALAPQSIDAIVDLLATGTTSRLHELAGKVGDPVEFASDIDSEPILFPTEEELVASASFTEAALPATAREVDTLSISVVHGDLRTASFPVLAGHYQGDMVVSAEAAIDRYLNGKLTERYRASLYPGPIGTAEVVHAANCSPTGALIVGLGEVGEITPEKVRRGVRTALLRHALLTLEEAATNDPVDSTERSWRSAAFSALLVGTIGGSSLSIESSLAAIVQGTIQANHALKAQGLWDRVRVDRIEVIELHEDIALAALRSAHNLLRLPPIDLGEDERLDVTPTYLLARAGGLFNRPANQYSTGWWRRIQISKVDDGKGGDGDLNFLSLTDRARAEDRIESTQRQLVDLLVNDAIQSTSYDARLCTTLYELLIPNLLKDQAGIEANLALILDRQAAQYPWELLAERANGRIDPFSLRHGLIRQFRVSSFRANPQGATELNALVVGDTQSGFAELPGAQNEAQGVAAALSSGGFTVTGPLLRPNSLMLINELFARDYRILHLAGHGDYNAEHPDESGMVLGGGVFLTSKEIAKLRVVPEFVFLNCCHLAKTDGSMNLDRPDRLAASVSEELIKIGVKAIVAAGWAVDDAAASTFARTLYESMLLGWSFGDAVLRARQETAKAHPQANTWGAYQCYGNPAYMLADQQVSSSSWKTPYSKREMVDLIGRLTTTACNRSSSVQEDVRRSLEVLLSTTPPFWVDGSVLAAMGRASTELGEFTTATNYYRRTLVAQGSGVHLTVLEDIVRSLLSEAREVWLKEPSEKSTDSLNGIHGEAEQRLNCALQLGATVDRKVLSAMLSRQRAMITTGAGRTRHLKAAEEALDEARLLDLKSTSSEPAVDAALSIEAVTCEWLRTRSRGPRSVIARLELAESQLNETGKHFYELRALGNALLLRGLIDGALDANWSDVAAIYSKAVEGDTSRNESDSIAEHLDFVTAILSAGDADLIEAIGRIKDVVYK